MLEKNIFFIDNYYIQQWLNIKISKKLNICANIKYIINKNFFFNLIHYIKKIKQSLLFNKYYLTWNLMSFIHKFPIDKQKKKIFLHKKFQLCLYLSELFIEYLHLKPHWIYLWENEKNNLKLKKSHIWQKNIWNELIKKIKNNSFTQLIKNFYLSIKQKKIKKKLPLNIFIISLENNTPFNDFIISMIKPYIQIHYYQYVAIKEKKNHPPKKFFSKIIQKEKINPKNKKKKIIKKIFIPQKSQSQNVLKKLQSDIFNSKFENQKKKNLYHIYDHSVSIVECQTYYQEIKTLYNYITKKINTDTKLKPHNILITAINIKKYIPYINYFFQYQKNNYTFFNTKNKNPSYKKRIFLIIKKLLNIKNNRFQHSWILSILDIPCIRKKFSIHSKDLSTIYSWMLKLGIYWGFDIKHLNNMSLPKIEQYTWNYAIKKITSGIFFKKENYSWNNIFPYSVSYTRGRILLGNFIDFILCLQKLYKFISTKKKLKSWLKVIPNILKNFFQIPDQQKKFFQKLKENWYNIIIHGIKENYSDQISINELIREFFKRKAYRSKNPNFILGTLNCIKLNKVKNIPFKMICILDCTQNFFSKKKNALNLINNNNIYNNTQNIFLETIMSAKNYLYCSYAIQKIKKENNKSSSIFIDNLQSYIQKNFYYIKKNKNKNIKKYKNILKYVFYNPLKDSEYQKNKIDKKSNSTTIKNISYCKKKNSNVKKKIKYYISKKIKLKNLIKFWQNPINYFFYKTLKIKINSEIKTILLKNEVFSVNLIEKYKINKKILSLLLSQKKTKKLFLKYQQLGKIPYGNIGKIFWKKQKNQIKKLILLINKKRKEPKTIKFKLKIKEYKLFGKLPEVNQSGLIRWTVMKINHQNTFSLWLEHLVSCALNHKKKSILLSIDNKILKFSSIKKSKALLYLKKYIQGYRTGLKKPIFLLKSGINWLTYHYTKKNSNLEKIARKKFLETWHGNFLINGEKNNIYIQKILPIMNEKYINKICKICKYWYLPVLKYHTIK
nr:exodeoxyribonuclease V subunit gamma [Buchnera aphidicola]